MSDDIRLERLLDDVLVTVAPPRAPARLRLDINTTTGQMRQRPRWLALIKERPMRLDTKVAVGSPTVRLASIMAISVALILAAAAAVVAGASLLPNQHLAPYGPAVNGSLAYTKDGDIYLADATGDHARPIITGPALDSDPTFSHDGSRIAFLRAAGNSPHLMVARADGTDVLPLAAAVDYGDWSPDDTTLAISHMLDGRERISIVDADKGAQLRTLELGDIEPAGWLAWRPTDGREDPLPWPPHGRVV